MSENKQQRKDFLWLKVVPSQNCIVEKKKKKHREVVNFGPNDDERKSQIGSNKQNIY